MPNKDVTVESIINQIGIIFQHLFLQIQQELLDLDLTSPQEKVVLLLYLNESERMTDLAAQLGVTLATATGIIDRLVEKDIVIRENKKGDRRVVMCTLSDKGRELTRRLWSKAQDETKELLLNIDMNRLTLFDKFMHELILKNKSIVRSDVNSGHQTFHAASNPI